MCRWRRHILCVSCRRPRSTSTSSARTSSERTGGLSPPNAHIISDWTKEDADRPTVYVRPAPNMTYLNPRCRVQTDAGDAHVGPARGVCGDLERRYGVQVAHVERKGLGTCTAEGFGDETWAVGTSSTRLRGSRRSRRTSRAKTRVCERVEDERAAAEVGSRDRGGMCVMHRSIIVSDQHLTHAHHHKRASQAHAS